MAFFGTLKLVLSYHLEKIDLLLGNFNSLPNDSFLNWSKLKVIADDKINVAQKMKPVSGRIENIVGKGENAGYQQFLLFPLCLSNGFFFKVVNKLGLCGKRLNNEQCYHDFILPD